MGRCAAAPTRSPPNVASAADPRGLSSSSRVLAGSEKDPEVSGQQPKYKGPIPPENSEGYR